MKDLRKKISASILGLPEGIVKTDIGDLKVDKIGTKFISVYNLHRQKYEKYTLKEFAFFALDLMDLKEAILEEAIREANSYFSLQQTRTAARNNR